MLTVSRTASNFKPCSEGWHDAHLAEVEDIGEMPNHFEEGKTQPKVKLVFEVDDDGEPVRVNGLYTLSLHEKSKLFAHMQSWLGSVPEEMDLEELIGKPCQLNVRHKEGKRGGIFANIHGIMPPKAEQTNFEASKEDTPF